MSSQPRHVRIFVSSPGDVADERSIAFKVIDDLLYDPAFVDQVTIRVVAWDKPYRSTPMLAAMTPQMAITAGLPKPSDCDIVVVIFWSKMGTPLPEEYHKEDGTRYLSGTEWEFDDALQAAKQSGSPEILVYKREEPLLLNPSDPNFMKNYEQWQKVENFFAQFSDPTTRVIHSGYNKYNTPDDFRIQFEAHLKTVIKRLIEAPIKPEKRATSSAESDIAIQREVWTGSPFPGLRSFTEKEAPIFFGRGRETDELIRRIQSNRFVSVIGVSGSGKSSLVAAGAIPRLINGAISDNQQRSMDWHIVKLTPGKDPFHRLAGSMLLQIPQLKGDPIEYSTRRAKLALALSQSPAALTETILSIFVDEPHWVEILLFIDQFEELFTLTPPEMRKSFIDMLVHAVHSSSLASLLYGSGSSNDRIRVVTTLRADFYHRCVEYPDLAELLRNGSFPLAAPSQLALYEMITKPAERAELEFEGGLPERILKDSGDEPGALALVAYTLDELYHAGKEGKRLTHADYDSLGGVRGAIGRRAEDIFEKLPQETQAMLPNIFQKLVAIEHRGPATRERALVNDIADDESSKMLIDAFTEARLLVQSRGEQGAVVEVAHEALFSSWDRLSEWVDKTRHDLYLLQQMRRAATLWDERGRSRDFLWLGERGQELQQVLDRLKPKLNEIERIFVRPEQNHLLDEIYEPQTTHARKNEIGLRMHVIGDIRPGVGLRPDGLPDIVWFRVPRGEVKIAGETFTVLPFYIAKYPITYVQYQSFVDDDEGFNNEIWWKDLPPQFCCHKLREQLQKFSNHPRDNVNWYQAFAFTRWLTAKMPPDGYPEDVATLGISMDKKWGIRLPTEWEWQQAATGGNPDNIYTWGTEWIDLRANTREAGLNRTIAVGMYPAAASPVGALDMGSNTREWCLNEYTNIRKVAPNSTRCRTLRGASFSCIKDFSKCVARHSDDPDEQPSDDGFRVVFAVELDPAS